MDFDEAEVYDMPDTEFHVESDEPLDIEPDDEPEEEEEDEGYDDEDGDDQWACPTCGKVCKTKAGLISHMKTHE
jgi:hypothetical protein